MFPHTITIYRHTTNAGADVYNKQTISGFYTVQNISLTTDQKGVDVSKPTTIISSAENAQKYGKEWTVQAKDRIVIGPGADITSFTDIPNAMTVMGIQINVIGSECDNITITCN